MVEIFVNIVESDDEKYETNFQDQSLYLNAAFKQHNELKNVFISGNLYQSITDSNLKTQNEAKKKAQNNLSSDQLNNYICEHYWGDYCAVYRSEKESTVSVFPDPTGLLEVYYCKQGNKVFVSNSFDWVVQKLEKNAVFRKSSIIDVVNGFEQFGSGTLIEGVHRIPLGHACYISSAGDITLKKIWPNLSKKINLDQSAIAAKLKEITSQVILQTSSKETSVFLSGGRDSSLLTAFFAGLHNDVLPNPLIHCKFEEKSGNEIKYAQYVTDKFSGKLHYINEEEYMHGFSALWSTPGVPIHYHEANYSKIAQEKTNCKHFLDGKVGDSIFLEHVNPEYLTNMKFKDALAMGIPNVFWKTVFSKTYIKIFAKRYLNNINKSFHLVLESKILSKYALSLSKQAINSNYFQSEIDYYLKQKNISNAAYLLAVLLDVSTQNRRIYYTSKFSYPFASQPVLDFLFSIDLNHFIGNEPRALQRLMLHDAGLENVASRQHKSGTGNVMLREFSNNQEYLTSLLTNGVFVKSGLIDLTQLDDIFLRAKAGLNSPGLVLLLKIIHHEIILQNLPVTITTQ